MTPETQTVEWKRVWRDEYLAWICGFANAQGGVLEIGRDDDGEVVGVRKVLSLLEDIPAKVRALLGIVVEVNLKAEAGREYIEIVVAPHPNPISYRGKFHYRSGSTKEVLEGAAFTRFLLERHGRTWDDVALPGVRLSELDGRTFEAFRHLEAESKRLPSDVLGESDDDVIERLQLREGALLKRASALLFHPAPHRLVMGAYVKIGAFQGGDLRFQDVIEGDLFKQVDRTLDLLYTKYARGPTPYPDDICRVKTLPVPRLALREAVINALIHRDYAEPASTQIRVNDANIEIRNPALLPADWAAVETGTLSRPHNPLIAQAFFRAGMIEAWGRGIRQIADHCRKAGSPMPSWTREPGGALCLRFPFSEAYLAATSDRPGTADAATSPKATSATPTTPTTPVAGAKTSQKTPERTSIRQRTARKSPENSQTTAHRPAPLDRVAATGEPVVILEAGKPVAELSPAVRSGVAYPQYELKGTVTEVGDIVEPPLPANDWESTHS